MCITDATDYHWCTVKESDSSYEDMSYSNNACLGCGFEVQLESSESELGCESSSDHIDIL